MLLPSLISLRRPHDKPPEPEDIFGSSLSGIFTDDLQNSYGDDPDTVIVYKSEKFGDLGFHTADVNGEEQRQKFAHYLWNAGILVAELVGGRKEQHEYDRDGDSGFSGMEEKNEENWGKEKWWVVREEEALWSVKGETVLELGAGVGLGGIASALSGAQEVAITDYPAPSILEAISINVAKNVPEQLRSRTTVHGHQWGELDTSFATNNAHRFTRVIVADCLWMSEQHDKLALSMLHFLSKSPESRVLCIAGFHTGRARMAPFFEEVAPKLGLQVEDIFEMDGSGKRREWRTKRCGVEDIGERNKWLVVARLRHRVES